MTYTATYSPEDNKLRLYTSSRLDAETYKRVRAAGFIWAPKQDLFVAPMWTPQREDLLVELAGEIGDEDTSLVDRAEQRAERFEDYSEKRAADADRAHQAVNAIADGIPLGQPILVGHHSERHARRDAEKIENGMRRAVKAWETSKYWTERAAGAIGHAKYKELPTVRARRIKTIESDLRRQQRTTSRAEARLGVWFKLHEPDSLKRKDGAPTTFLERAKYLANVDQGSYDIWRGLTDGTMTPEEAQRWKLAAAANDIAWAARWIAHYENRLAYERAMLAESGYVPPPKPKTKADLPLLNYAGACAYRNPYHRSEIVRAEAVGMTRAEWAAIGADYKGTRVSECGTHRLRTGLIGQAGKRGLCVVYLTDSKQHARPAAAEIEAKAAEENAAREAAANRRVVAAASAPARSKPVPTVFDDMKESLRAGVQTVSAPQLFPTPAGIAAQMIEAADIQAGHRVLEPSAGTGVLGEAARVAGGVTTLVEVAYALADRLRLRFDDVRQADFLTCNGDLGKFDRVVMNPPFSNGDDIRHILHARTFLKPGGRLVALCANGPRQQEKLRPLASSWEDLPEGSFKEAGTGVRVALLTIDAEQQASPTQGRLL